MTAAVADAASHRLRSSRGWWSRETARRIAGCYRRPIDPGTVLKPWRLPAGTLTPSRLGQLGRLGPLGR